jgi:endonuclease/exonuclease/phosphatase family metal-dependent hydrolase
MLCRISWFRLLLLGPLALASWCSGHEPIDLFSDVPELGPGFVRLAAWNVRHLDLAADSEGYFPGRDQEAKFQVLLASFAKAVRDLQLDLLVLVEVQPRTGEPERLGQFRELLEAADPPRNREGPGWQWTRTEIEYDEPEDPYGNLQFGLLWNATRGIRMGDAGHRVLHELRQPRSPSGELLNRVHRAPWLVPIEVTDGTRSERLDLDLLAVHFKSGGATPQAAEVDAVVRFVREHHASPTPRHLIVCGDWNIRPDEDEQGRGRPRLRKMSVPRLSSGRDELLRLLTVGELPPSLEEWEQLTARFGNLEDFPALAARLPFTHLGASAEARNTLLDHMAISHTLDELFDHPVEVRLANGETDVWSGIEIATPRVPHADYLHFTDHLPVILTLRVASTSSDRAAPPVRILAAEPNPLGDETIRERVLLKNMSSESIDLAGWRIQDATGNCWTLDRDDSNQADGRLARGRTLAVRRRGRAMALSNGGDRIGLLDARGALIDSMHFGPAATGEMVWNECP